jgi:hypothetical protein
MRFKALKEKYKKYMKPMPQEMEGKFQEPFTKIDVQKLQ